MIPLAVKAIMEGFRISSYTPGAAVQLVINTIMPNDLLVQGHTIDELVQQEPAGAGPWVWLGSCRVCARLSGARTTIRSVAGPDQDLHDRQEHDHAQQRPAQP